MPGDSEYVFLQCVDVLARCWLPQAAAPVCMQAVVRFGVKLRSGLLSISVHSYGHSRGLGYTGSYRCTVTHGCDDKQEIRRRSGKGAPLHCAMPSPTCGFHKMLNGFRQMTATTQTDGNHRMHIAISMDTAFCLVRTSQLNACIATCCRQYSC